MTYTTTTQLISIDAQTPDPETIALAAEVIRNQGLVAFPTETVYGLGANGLDAEAVAHIFEAKERPANDPVILHITEITQLEQIGRDIAPIAYDLMAAFSPGALTLVLKKQPIVPNAVTAGGDTVAVRIPDHPVALALIEAAGVPIAAPSANRFSRPSPTTAEHVLHDLDGRVDVILDGGAVTIGVESTIVDLTDKTPRVLRPGGISLEKLRDYLPSLIFKPRYLPEDVEQAPSPGTLLKHYSPSATVLLFQGDEAAVSATMLETTEQYLLDGQAVGVLAMGDDADLFTGIAVQIALLGDTLDEAANRLFAGLRQLDELAVDVILVRAPQQANVGLAVYDRLLRAAEGQVIEI